MSELTIKNGALYNRQGEKVKLEFGNREQIKAIRDYERKMEDLKTDGVELHPHYDISVDAEVYFKCNCGRVLWFRTECDEEGDLDCFEDMKKTCNCGNTYQLSVDDVNDVILCKLIQDKP